MSVATGGPLVLPRLGCHVGKASAALIRVEGGSGFGVACDAEVGQAPAAVEEQHVFGLEIAVDNTSLEVRQGLGDVAQDAYGLFQGQASRLFEMRSQRRVGAGHDEHPVVLVFAAVDDGHDVAGTLQLGEQQLPVSARSLRHQLDGGKPAVGGAGFEDCAEATLPEAFANHPLFIQFQPHARASPSSTDPLIHHAGTVRQSGRVAQGASSSKGSRSSGGGSPEPAARVLSVGGECAPPRAAVSRTRPVVERLGRAAAVSTPLSAVVGQDQIGHVMRAGTVVPRHSQGLTFSAQRPHPRRWPHRPGTSRTRGSSAETSQPGGGCASSVPSFCSRVPTRARHHRASEEHLPRQ